MRHIALAGKGSAGKSTLAPFLVDILIRRESAGRLLVVDGDPHGTLTRLLGVAPRATLGQLRSQYEREFRTGAGLDGETRAEFAEGVMGEEALTPAAGYDFIGLGRWELPGSNCVPNRILGHALTALMSRYDTLLMDNEAGLEHIGRYAALPVDTLVLVVQPDPLFWDVAGQILNRAREIGRTVGQVRWVINRVRPEDAEHLGVGAEMMNGQPAAVLPESPGLRALSRAGRSPLELPAADVWRAALEGARLV